MEQILMLACYIPPTKTDDMKTFISMLEDYRKSFKNILVTGDFNAKSKLWGNQSDNYAGELLENFVLKSSFMCINDGIPTRRNSDSVIDLILITPTLRRKIECCQTLDHENVRSDHIAVLVKIEDGIPRGQNEYIEKYNLRKVDWKAWNEETTVQFNEWNGSNNSNTSMDDLYDSFLRVFKNCMDKCIPKVRVPINHRKTTHPWTNEDVKTAKRDLNSAKRHFRRRKTPNLLLDLQEKEQIYKEVCEDAKSKWIDETCTQIDRHTDPGQKWQTFHKLTSYEESDVDIMLPLIDKGNPAFDKGKCRILRNTFLDREHVKNESFDAKFKFKIEDKLNNIRNGIAEEPVDDFLNHEITRSEVEAALQRL
ncbi:uncharacterized protein LOC128546371 [Mercenaria mercenaria]|uniref:uncharacterized protein LOC128546371 n=1 Tax=Mercenaria mercenaria TaxID=6596 RepID=UPI00234F0312|nr:uncharacterized protein LOC128546371 [Mercenaria mercenaria]